MESIESGERSWERIGELAAAGDATALAGFLKSLGAPETARALARLSPEDQQQVLTLLEPNEAAELIEQISQPQAADLLEEIDPQAGAAILHELGSSDQADLIVEVGEKQAEAILAEMKRGEATSLRELASYPADTAGGLMVTELLSFPATATLAAAMAELQRDAERYADYQVQYLYVVGERGELLGVVRLRDLVLNRPDRSLQEVMIREPVHVQDDLDLESLEQVFDVHQFLAVPVVDAQGRLLGILQKSEVERALASRLESDYRKAQGIVGGEELRTFPYLTRSRRRLSWLSINVVLNLVAASIIAFYQETLAAVIALAAFLPIISDMSGCSGNQAVAVSMRELTLGVITPRDAWLVWRKEAAVGLLNGVVLGGILGGVAFLWQSNLYLGLVVAAALAINTVVAVSVGGVVPLLLKGVGLDPALASGPILTTVTDMCGFFLTLSMATAMLAALTVG